MSGRPRQPTSRWAPPSVVVHRIPTLAGGKRKAAASTPRPADLTLQRTVAILDDLQLGGSGYLQQVQYKHRASTDAATFDLRKPGKGTQLTDQAWALLFKEIGELGNDSGVRTALCSAVRNMRLAL